MEEQAQGNNSELIPSSWNYGSFHLQSRLYTNNKSPLNQTSPVFDAKGKYMLPPHDTPRNRERRASKVDHVKDGQKLDGCHTRKVFTSTGLKRPGKSLDCPKNKVASEEYYMALKVYKEIAKNSQNLDFAKTKAMSMLLGGKYQNF